VPNECRLTGSVKVRLDLGKKDGLSPAEAAQDYIKEHIGPKYIEKYVNKHDDKR
jgi:hypothetical protein